MIRSSSPVVVLNICGFVSVADTVALLVVLVGDAFAGLVTTIPTPDDVEVQSISCMPQRIPQPLTVPQRQPGLVRLYRTYH